MPARVWSVISILLLTSHAIIVLAVSVHDDSGRLVRLTQPASRVITLAPNLTELVYDIGAGKHVVATVQYSNYPSAAKHIPRIGSSDSLNLEAILSFHPDLVLAWRSGNRPQQLRAIERMGIPVYRSEPHSLQDIVTTLIRLGKLLGAQAQADHVAKHLRSGIAELKHHYAGHKAITGFYQIWNQPIYTINGRHIISHVMGLCGIHNIFADAPILAPVVSKEAVLAKNPQMIISGGSPEVRSQNLAIWQSWSQLTAVRAHNLFYIDADLMQRDTPRILEGARILCHQADIARKHLRALKKGARHTDGENRREE
jgi:iron complex transport system substrate-binding protein